jgi:hypothetical protein
MGEIIMAFRKVTSLLTGLVIPYLSVLGGIAFIGKYDTPIFGIPILYFWIFLWLPLTSLCLAISWSCFDRYEYQISQTRKDDE